MSSIAKSKLVITLVVVVEAVLLTAWLVREYFEFDYTCFISQLQYKDVDSDLLPEDAARLRKSRDVFAFSQTETDVQMETLLSIDNVNGIRTKTTRNKSYLGLRKRRKKKPNSKAIPSTTTSPIIYTVSLSNIDSKELEFTVTEDTTTTYPTTIDMDVIGCADCNINQTSEVIPTQDQALMLELQYFSQHMICFGRTLLDFWSLLQVVSTSLMLVGIWMNLIYMLTPFLVLKMLFLVVSFIYGVTLTVFSVTLFILVKEMKWQTLIDWVSFALIMDILFIVVSFNFLLILQCCDSIFVAPPTKRRRSLATYNIVNDV
ncbi:unnamed protein product [Bursaphelenchus okinawaensis]|uniref:Uncharacterized protein n=1 Tax=Bursaphelenchus okinawaensis TaxID=465554 RepID=A0A811JU46_9BILA|nr:unnamed protein product [Bursaphelenchus okinawaensis]CAG9083328.1 unnamed protein product [Bursaphelenchus okinawaensis]